MTDIKDHPLYRVHTIDTAMNSLWEFYKKNFLVLFGMSIAIAFAVQYASSFINLKDIQSETDPMLILEKLKPFLFPMVMISLLNLLLTAILQHYIINNPVESSNTVLYSVIRSFRYFIPYLVILVFLSFAGSVAIVLGFFALVVGAVFAVIYIMTLYMFILPVMMVEGPDIGQTAGRVIKLAHRNFWTNFGWVSVFIVLLIVVSFILSGIVLLPFAGSYFRTLFKPEDVSAAADVTSSPLFLILSALVNALTIPLMPIFASILYFNGRAREEQKEEYYQPAKETDKVRVEDLYAKPYAEDHPENQEKE